jgi:hypothetical protein
MTDVAYQCHTCGSVHEVESIRLNLILDLRAAVSYELSGQRRILNPRARFLRWRMTLGLAQALWPGHPHDARLAGGRRLAPEPHAQLSDRPVPFRVIPAGSDARAVTKRQPVPVADLPVSAFAPEMPSTAAQLTTGG